MAQEGGEAPLEDTVGDRALAQAAQEDELGGVEVGPHLGVAGATLEDFARGPRTRRSLRRPTGPEPDYRVGSSSSEASE